MVLIETIGQQTKIRDFAAKIRESETQRNARKRDFETHSKRLRDLVLEIGTQISETLNFPGAFATPNEITQDHEIGSFLFPFSFYKTTCKGRTCAT